MKTGLKRVIVAIILLIAALMSVYTGGFLLALFLGAFIFVGIRELVAIAEVKGLKPPFYFIVISCFVLVGLACFRLYDLLFPSFTIITILAFLLILARGRQSTLNDVSMIIFSIIYAGVFPIHMLMTRDLGMGLMLMMFLVVASCDIGAYYTGMAFGKTPLWKAISPKKTVEGSIGGTIAGVVTALIVGNIIGLNVLQSLSAGAIIAIMAQLGDLAESMLKREVGIKDSGTVFPGHGGVLDRTDSYIFTGVVTYYYFKFFIV